MSPVQASLARLLERSDVGTGVMKLTHQIPYPPTLGIGGDKLGGDDDGEEARQSGTKVAAMRQTIWYDDDGDEVGGGVTTTATSQVEITRRR
jgi:hypothetical protein